MFGAMIGAARSGGGELSRAVGSCGAFTSAGKKPSSSAGGNTISDSLKSTSGAAEGANIVLAGGLVKTKEYTAEKATNKTDAVTPATA
jgi:hypothetical protein